MPRALHQTSGPSRLPLFALSPARGLAPHARRLSTAFIMARSFRTKMAIVRDGWECSWRGAGVCACMIPLGRSIGVAAGSGTDYSLPKQS